MNELTLSQKLQSKIQAIMEAPTEKLSELAKIAGLSLSEDYIGVDLSGEDLSDDDLSGANLSRVNLSQANLSNTSLKKVDFRGANLEGAILTGADLSFANLKETDISKKTKIDAKWRDVWEIVNQQVECRYLRNKDLSFANLSYANLQRACLSNTKLKGALLEEANLSSADLRYANFESADLRSADLTRATIDETTNFVSANVKSMRFGGNFGLSPTIKQDLIGRGAIFTKDVTLPVIPPSIASRYVQEEIGLTLRAGEDTEVALE